MTMASNMPTVKRYFARVWENEIPDFETHYEPLKALITALIVLIVLEYASRLRSKGIERVLLRSFPLLADRFGFITRRPQPSFRPGYRASSSFALSILGAWYFDRPLWSVLLGECMLSNLCLDFGALIAVGLLEIALRLSFRFMKLVGFIPFDEPDFTFSTMVQHSPIRPEIKPDQSPKHDSPLMTPEANKPMVDWPLASATKPYRERLVQLSQNILSPLRPRQSRIEDIDGYQAPTGGYRVEDPLAQSPALFRPHTRSNPPWIEKYQSITAGDQNQAKSFEELRLERYQEETGS